MKWAAQEVEMYIKSKEYVDTAVIPLLPVSLGENMKETAAMAEFITMLSVLLEREFAGRIFLLPPFTYMKDEANGPASSRLRQWSEEIKNSGFKHIFYLTSDSEWRMLEENFADSLLWMPALPIDQLNDSQKWAMMDSQVKQLLSFFTRKWREIE